MSESKDVSEELGLERREPAAASAGGLSRAYR